MPRLWNSKPRVCEVHWGKFVAGQVASAEELSFTILNFLTKASRPNNFFSLPNEPKCIQI